MVAVEVLAMLPTLEDFSLPHHAVLLDHEERLSFHTYFDGNVGQIADSLDVQPHKTRLFCSDTQATLEVVAAVVAYLTFTTMWNYMLGVWKRLGPDRFI